MSLHSKVFKILNVFRLLLKVFMVPLILFLSGSQCLGLSLDDTQSEILVFDSSPRRFQPTLYSDNNTEARQNHSFIIKPEELLKWPAYQIQICAETEDNITSGNVFPLLVTASWHGSIRSWEIPVVWRNSSIYYNSSARFDEASVGKTLWNYPPDIPIKLWNLTVEANIISNLTVTYRIKIIALPDFIVFSNSSNINVIVTPSSPATFKVATPPDDWEHVFIEVTSDTDSCSLLTIEKEHGPFLDALGITLPDSTYGYETFTMKAGLTIRTKDVPQGFLIVFNQFLTNAKCMGHHSDSHPHTSSSKPDLYRKKRITFQIRGSLPASMYYFSMAAPVVFIIGYGIAAIIIMWYFHRRRVSQMQGPQVTLSRNQSLFKSNIKIDEIILTAPEELIDKSKRYCWAVVVTSSFYCVPVFQLILTFSRRLSETGNYDTCYFNHFCSHMLGNFHDFNHMYSNIGYILFGLFYAVLVKIRQLCYVTKDIFHTEGQTTVRNRSLMEVLFPKLEPEPENGVLAHPAILYCMGFALVMMGIMSTGYHICPNQNNFQFDTVFMYTIAAVTIVTLYQFRHPTYISANSTFCTLALVTCVTVLGLLWEEFWTRVAFSGVHIIFLLLSLPKICYNGYVRKDGHLVVHWHHMMKILFMMFEDDWRNGKLFKVQHSIWRAPNNPDVVVIPGPGRLILPAFLLCINALSTFMMWTTMINQNFATQVLFICVINGAFYTIFYSCLKWYHGECSGTLWLQPAFYQIASLILWPAALTFFVDEQSTWEDSPAESRVKNSHCVVMGFYDSHDIWHFLSSAGLFSSAMVLLTIDDDLLHQPKSTIPVF